MLQLTLFDSDTVGVDAGCFLRRHSRFTLRQCDLGLFIKSLVNSCSNNQNESNVRSKYRKNLDLKMLNFEGDTLK